MRKTHSPTSPWGIVRHAATRFVVVSLACEAIGTLAILWRGIRGRTTDRFSGLPFVDMWIRWDAGWYQGIATDGYYFSATEQSSVAFFPTYPLLIRLLFRLGVDPFIAGIVITTISGLVAVVLFEVWVSGRGGDPGERATWHLLLWPFAYYLYGAVYSDALFLSLVIGAFLLLERGSLVGSTALGALATATRPVGVAVVLALVLRQRELRHLAHQRWRPVDLAPLLASAGLLTYVLFLWIRFGDPLAFATTQRGWHQLTGSASWLKLSLFRRGLTFDVLTLPMIHAALAVGFLLLAIPIRRQLGWGYAAYVVIVIGMPLLSSRDFIGLGRYCLAAFPCFWILARKLARPAWLRRTSLAVSGALLAIMTWRFAIGLYTA